MEEFELRDYLTSALKINPNLTYLLLSILCRSLQFLADACSSLQFKTQPATKLSFKTKKHPKTQRTLTKYKKEKNQGSV